VAVVIQTETGRKAQRPSARQFPRGNRRQIMRCIPQSETVAVAQSAVQFRAENIRCNLVAYSFCIFSLERLTQAVSGSDSVPDLAGGDDEC